MINVAYVKAVRAFWAHVERSGVQAAFREAIPVALPGGRVDVLTKKLEMVEIMQRVSDGDDFGELPKLRTAPDPLADPGLRLLIDAFGTAMLSVPGAWEEFERRMDCADGAASHE